MWPLPAAAYDAMVEWRAVTGAKKYRLYVRYNNGSFALAKESTASGAAGIQLADVLPNISLAMTTRFAVSAVSSGGSESPKSNVVAIDYAAAARIVDTDGDGLADADEDVNLNGITDAGETDRKKADTDGDGLSDFDERNVHRTDPLKVDTDGDGASDGTEVATGTNPRDATSSPNVWVLASDPYASFSGAMKTGTAYTGGADLDPAADSIGKRLVFAGSTVNAMTPGSPDHVSYAIDLPKSGQWFLWGRFYFPGEPNSNDANSFFASIDGGVERRFGNDKDMFRKWHWDGDGSTDYGGSIALPLGYLTAGGHTLTIEKREVTPVAPRLDVLLLTLDGKTVPKDAAASAGLAANPAAPACTSNAACDDGNKCNGAEICDPVAGCKAGTPLVCNDGNACNGVETCVASTGCKAGTPPVCNDGNACNGLETCSPATGCKAGTPLVCNDGNACNGVETCVASTGCKAGTPPVCNDGKFCNGVETCNSTFGCVPGRPVDCAVLGNQCEAARCNETAKSCEVVPKNDGMACNDGLACTVLDICVDGTCTGADSCPAGEVCEVETGQCELSTDRDNDGLFDTADPCPDDARNRCAGWPAVDRTTGRKIRINAGTGVAGAGQRTDCNGDVWYADFGFRRDLGATSCTLANGCRISNIDSLFGCNTAATEDLFQSDHSSVASDRRIVYDFTVPDAAYLVNLYFANTQSDTTAPGDRVFDIIVEGTIAFSGFDQVDAAGRSGALVVRSVVVDVLDGNGLTIAVQPRVGEAAIKAIEILRTR